LRLRPQDVTRLRARLDALAPSRREPVDSIYLDTPDRRLARARAALRLRALGSGRRMRWVQTLKTDDGGAAFSLRGEWETQAPGGRLSPALLAHSPLARLLAAPGPGVPGALAPVFRTRFERTTWNLAYRGARIEAVIDDGAIEAGPRREAILEAELELKDGPAQAVWRLARELCGGAGRSGLYLLPYGDSKAARGYRLALDLAPFPAGARPLPRIDPRQSAGQTARDLLAHEMIPLLANVAGVLSSADPGFAHRARVGVRRMRAGLESLDTPLPAGLAHGLQRLGAQLGAARDWDVLCEKLLPPLVAAQGGQAAAAWSRVVAAAQRRRQAALQRLRGQLAAPSFAQWALRLLQWSAAPPPAPGIRVDRVAGKSVRRGVRRVAVAARGFSRRSPQRQHRIRLQAKAVRYAIDILGEVLPRKRSRAARRALARFQDAAGHAQDMCVLVRSIARLTRSATLRRAALEWTEAQRARAIAEAQRHADALSAWR